jgi:tRNA nucleotidyltransferase (CCA-adding enzyme)
MAPVGAGFWNWKCESRPDDCSWPKLRKSRKRIRRLESVQEYGTIGPTVIMNASANGHDRLN